MWTNTKLIPSTKTTEFQKKPGGFLDRTIDQITGKDGKISQPFITSGNGILTQGIGGGTIEQNTYSIQFRHWWKSLPYGFRYNPRNGQPSLLFYLPINPQNIQVRTPFATHVVSTMYGTVEEHSEVRYFDIVISGNTGITPKFSQIFREGRRASDSDINHVQRQSYNRGFLNADVTGGFFRRTTDQINTALKGVQGVAANIKGETTVQTGVQQAYSGFAAFHNFFRFLLEYKRDTSGVANTDQRRRHPLQFLNYKDGSEYDCAIQDFSWVKSASDPFLYNYTIVMRCYNLRTIDKANIDNALGNRYAQLGLDGVSTSTAFSRMAGVARNAKNTAYSAVGVLSAGGRGF